MAPPEDGDFRQATPVVRPIAPVPVTSHLSPPTTQSLSAVLQHTLPPVTQVAESSKSAGKRVTPHLFKFKASRPGDGWYVAHNAVHPGVYYGA